MGANRVRSELPLVAAASREGTFLTRDRRVVRLAACDGEERENLTTIVMAERERDGGANKDC